MERHTLVSFNESSRFTNGDWVGGWEVLGYTGSLGPHRCSHYQEQRKHKIVGKVGLGAWGCLPDREAVVWIDPLQQAVQL